MASVNNIYLVLTDPPTHRYVKSIPSKIAGVRLDADGKNQVGFVLQSQTSGEFSYDDEVLEIYSDREDRFLRQVNKGLFKQGLLQPFKGELPDVDMSNVLSDEAIVEIASIRNLPQLQKRLQEITSPFTVKRVYDTAVQIGRPQKTIAAINERLEIINNGGRNN